MSLSVDQVTAYVGAVPITDDAFAASCLATAEALIESHLGGVVVLDEIQDRATLEVAAELFHRRQAPSGIAQFATPEGPSPIRIARDPMTPAYPILAPFIGPVIA